MDTSFTEDTSSTKDDEVSSCLWWTKCPVDEVSMVDEVSVVDELSLVNEVSSG